MSRFASLLVVLSLTFGCSKGASEDGLDCPAVADKVVAILKADMGKLTDSQRQALEAQFATIRSELIEDCKKDPAFFEPKAECIMKAESTADLEACESSKPDDSDEQEK
jgi:hypothetical protein